MTITLTEAHAKYYSDWSPEAQEASLQRNRYDLARWTKLIGDSPVDSVTTQDFTRYRKLGLEDGQARSTVNSTCRTVVQVLRCCRDFGVIDQVPPTGRQLRIASPEWHVPTAKQIDKLYRATHLAKWPRLHVRPWEFWRCVIVLGIWTGLRKSDLLWGLKWSDVDLKEMVITYRASKTQKRHQFPIDSTAARHLRAMLLPGQVHSPKRHVFEASRSPHLVRRELRRFSDDAGIDPYVTMQTLRRVAVTSWSKADPTAGQLVHGTGLPRVMLHYLDPLEVLRSAAERFPWPNVIADRQPGDVWIPDAPEEIPEPPDELIVPTGPNPKDWHFKPGCFRYRKGPWFKMGGRRLEFLRLLAKSKHPVSWKAFVPLVYPKGTDWKTIDTTEDRRIHVTLSQVRMRLRDCFNLNGFDPIQCIEKANGGGTFVLFLPEGVIGSREKGGAA